MATLSCLENRQMGTSHLVGSTPTLSAKICSNVIMVVGSLGKRVSLKGVGGSSPLCCAKPPLAANMGRYPVAGSGPDCKSGA